MTVKHYVCLKCLKVFVQEQENLLVSDSCPRCGSGELHLKKTQKTDLENINLRGDRHLWFGFIHVVKDNGLMVWDALEPLLIKFVKENKKGE